MKNTLNANILWAFVMLTFLLLCLGSLLKLMHWSFYKPLLFSGILLYFLTTLLLIIDIVSHKVYNSFFWIISMLIFPSVTSVIYLIRRKNITSAN
ncbi:MAG: hypothetical protein R2836_03765 [Chitinophagales bacterium]|nr:hypothetical protein [Bacteroidota bacterium]MCB9226487.1 hypothetical protein [Chitinophagales bacterium]